MLCLIMTKKITIDFVGNDPENDEFVLFLVEEGPWENSSSEDRLRVIQDRLYNTVDVAIDGILFEKYPNQRGRKVRIQLDCYDPPSDLIKQLVNAVDQFVNNSEEYQSDIKNRKNVASISFTYREDRL